jgi:hypothetical protein
MQTWGRFLQAGSGQRWATSAASKLGTQHRKGKRTFGQMGTRLFVFRISGD